MVARLAGRSELPPTVRVQLVTATRKGVRGVHRVRARRVLSEAFRVHVLTELRQQIHTRLHPNEALTVLLMDVSPADSPPTVNRTGPALAARVSELLERLGR
ncbi:MAG: hypothetical protein JJ896_04270 [Rhodothermales bacterium]|nr:hypothetical protein [Rhodothermales bacterium]MBO6778847.1 hypothetical protein [Rhodothermales bacterium]